MIRVLQATSADITVTFYANGVATDTDAPPTYTITRDNGDALASGTATSTGTDGEYKATLTDTHTAALDVLRVDWTGDIDGATSTITTYAEIRGGLLFTVAEARRIKPLDNATAYPTGLVVAARTLAETALEDECGVPFVPTYFRERIDGRGRTDLLLPIVRPLTITAVTIDGTALSGDDLAALELYDDGRIYREAGWSAGRRNVIVTGTHGYAFAPARVGHAAIRLAKWALVDSPVSDRATSLTTEDGMTQFLVTGGTRRAVFDLPACNAVVERYGIRDALTVG